MRRFSGLVAGLALLAIAALPMRALAASSLTATLPVQASVTSGCLIATIGINFGAISPLLVEEDLTTEVASANGAVEVACGTNGPTSGSFINVALDNGANGAIAPILGIGTKTTAIRAMTNGTSFLAYDLFQPSVTTGTGGSVIQFSCNGAVNEWGNGLSGVGSSSPGAASQGATAVTIPASVYASLLQTEASGIVIPVCGSVGSDQVQPLTPGIYTDTVTATVSF